MTTTKSERKQNSAGAAATTGAGQGSRPSGTGGSGRAQKSRGAASGGPDGMLWVAQFALIIWALISTIPLLWAMVSSFKSNKEIVASPWSLPSRLNWDNFVRAWNEAHIGQYFLNTVVVVGGGVVLTMVFSAMAAYVFARYEFPGKRLLYYGFIAGMTFPVFMAVVPLFFVVKNLGMISTYHGLILVYVAYSLPFSVFFLTSFFKTLPVAVAEAAIMDGASHYRVFFSVMLPMAKPGLISIGIFNFIGQWNQYLLPLVLVPDESKYVLAQGLANLAVNQGYKSDISGLFAGLTIAILPILVVYVIFQRRVQAGMTAGAMK
ncbi:carbohydrate ABC transporter permease [Saxibacter everestensis]|uniref:Carbohydrate ABC transporter permease n=1 Tax=Saxibacter everestensis TaxID=2909229 RepID=A0ABY8QTV2_9MICO|nr:carbohydrate ABC transporter permease [Brevibacteriaceae bacterium ZFBP1038]